jgi:hypothetical protein
MTEKTMELELDKIRIDGGTQPRQKIDEDAVTEYAHSLRCGAVFPPVTVFHDGATYWLADGFHRYHACRRTGRDKIIADIRSGTQRDAILFSVGTNTDHGLRRKNEDKAKAVKTLLSLDLVKHDEAGNPWSDSGIAKLCRVDAKTVAKYRQQMGEDANQLTMEFHSEKPAPTPDPDTVRTYTTKHGTKSTMKTARIGRRGVKRKPARISPKAYKPIVGHSEHFPKAALELPHDTDWAARTLISTFSAEWARRLIDSLNHHLNGATDDLD